MSGLFLVVITGAPATGKTTLGRAIAQALGWPFFYKDGQLLSRSQAERLDVSFRTQIHADPR